jgi:hypothetical protein
MAIDQATYTQQTRETVAKQLPNIVPAADAARLGGLGAALAVQNAQQTSLVLNRARASAKYGPSSRAVGAMDARLKTVAATAGAIRAAQVNAQIQPPSLPAGAAGIFGRVVDATGAGIASAVVVAIDQTSLASRKAKADTTGTYQLVLPIRGSKTAASTSSQQPAAAAPSVAVHLEVQINTKTVLTSSETLTLHAGDLALRVLTVSSSADQTAA